MALARTLKSRAPCRPSCTSLFMRSFRSTLGPPQTRRYECMRSGTTAKSTSKLILPPTDSAIDRTKTEPSEKSSWGSSSSSGRMISLHALSV